MCKCFVTYEDVDGCVFGEGKRGEEIGMGSVFF
jgi:hypothetical protein